MAAKDTTEAYLIKQGKLLQGNVSNGECGDYSQFNMQMTPMTGMADGFLPSNRSMDESMVHFHENFESNFRNSLPSPRPSTRGDPMNFTVDNMMSLDGTNNSIHSIHSSHSSNSSSSSNSTSGSTGSNGTNGSNSSTNSSPNNLSNNAAKPHTPPQQQQQQQRPDQQGQSYTPRGHIPSLREIRALNSPSTVLQSLPPVFSEAQHEDTRKITNGLTTFCSAILAMHAEMAGIAGVVSEYLAWVRKSLAAGGPDPNRAAVLETLEGRVREMQEMAETRANEAWGNLVHTLKSCPANEALAATLSSFEVEAQERVERTRRFFQESYDVCARLSEQMMSEDQKE